MGYMGILLEYTQSHILSTRGGLYIFDPEQNYPCAVREMPFDLSNHPTAKHRVVDA